MATYERDTRVRAPLSDVWAFHSTIDGLRTLTPNWMQLRVEAIDHPEGSRDAHVLTPGTRIRMSLKPLGAGPRQQWTSRIESREHDDGYAYFVDEMVAGPFPQWRHTHLFYGDGDETLIRDHVSYRTPAGRLGDRLAGAFFEPMFRYRHRRTREIFDGA